MKDVLGGLRGKFGNLWKHRAKPAIRHHHHDELEFNLVVRGTVRYLVDDRRHDMRRHDILWLFPDHEHLLVQSSPDAEMWIGVLKQGVLHRLCTPAVANALTAPRLAGPCLRSLPPERSRWLDALCEDLERRRSGPDQPDSDGFNTGLIHVFVLAWEAFRAPGDSVGSGGADVHPAVEQAARLIAGGDDRSFAALAKAVGLTRTALSRRFRRDLGLSLVEHRNRCRIERFLDLRRGGRRTVLDAALAAGFGSYPQFHRMFRRMMGVSPREHRSE
jgi:AraC-like DNA-binding protein